MCCATRVSTSTPSTGAWLCDKGRFDFEAIESDVRLSEPLIRKNDELIAATWSEALGAAAEAIGKADAAAVAVLVGPGSRTRPRTRGPS